MQQNTKYGLTPRQKETLEFIEYFIERNQMPPTWENIMDGINLKSKAGVSNLVNQLKDRGYIDFMPYKARSIIVL